MSNEMNEIIQKARKKHFPIDMGRGVKAHIATKEDTNVFIGKKLEEYYGGYFEHRHFMIPEGREEILAPNFEAFSKIHHEHILFIDEKGDPIGWHLGEMKDPLCYYMRGSSIAPSVRKRQHYNHFLINFLKYLKDLNYERVECHHPCDYNPMILAKLKADFFITGMIIHEAYGDLVVMNYFLQEDRRKSFVRQFGCA